MRAQRSMYMSHRPLAVCLFVFIATLFAACAPDVLVAACGDKETFTVKQPIAGGPTLRSPLMELAQRRSRKRPTHSTKRFKMHCATR